MFRLTLLTVLALSQLGFTVANIEDLYESLMMPTYSTVPSEPEDLDTSEPVLWQMAAFGARQMSQDDKRQKFKLVTLSSAERVDNIYKLKVTLQRLLANEAPNKRDILYCTLEVKSTGSEAQPQWSMDKFGCTLPALIRRRRPIAGNNNNKPTQTFNKNSEFESNDILSTRKLALEPLSNSIEDDGNYKVSLKRSLPVLYRTRLVHYMPSYQRNYQQQQPPVFHPRYL